MDYSTTLSVTLSFAFISFIFLNTRAPSDCIACKAVALLHALLLLHSPPACPSLPQHLCCPPRRVRPLAVTARLSPRGEIPHHFARLPPQFLLSLTSSACGATAADNTQTSHLQFPGAESSLHLTISSPMGANSSSTIALAPSPPSPTPRSPSGLTDMQRICFLLQCQVIQLLMIPFNEPGSFSSQNIKCSKYSVGASWPN